MRAATPQRARRIRLRLTVIVTVTVVVVTAAAPFPRLAADVPDEVRMDSLGPRGIVFRDAPPAGFSENIAAAGDVDGDGFDDFLVLHVDPAASPRETLFLVRGERSFPAATRSELAARATLLRTMADSHGWLPLGPAGDIDGDGFDDFLVGQPAGEPADWPHALILPGLVYLVHGTAPLPPEIVVDDPAAVRVTTITTSRDRNTRLATAVDSGGDFNGDGLPDLAIGAGVAAEEPGQSGMRPGRVYVLFGGQPLIGTVDVEEAGDSRAGFILVGEGDAETGDAVAFAGDVNGDGRDDLLVGAPSGDSRFDGNVFLLFGDADPPPVIRVGEIAAGGLGVRLDGDGLTPSFGRSLGPAGDVNGDGLADFAVWAPRGALVSGGFEGGVQVVFGSRDLPAVLGVRRIPELDLGARLDGIRHPGVAAGIAAGSSAGASLALVRHDADAIPDLVVGAHRFSDPRATNAGRVWIVHGGGFEAGSRSLAEVLNGGLSGGLLTTRERAWLGSTVAAAGDVNGDGHDDLLVSAPFRFQDAESGRVYLVWGAGGQPAPLAVDGASPAVAPLRGGGELTVLGSGFTAETTVRVAGVSAPVRRVDTSSRVVVVTPPGARLGPADIEVRRGQATARLAGGLTYVERIYPELDLAAAPDGRTITLGPLRSGAVALADLDGDAYGDLIAVHGSAFVVAYGRPDPPGELALDGPGVSVVETGAPPPGLRDVVEVGDLNGDGLEDVALTFFEEERLLVVAGGERLPPETFVEELADSDRVWNLLTPPAPNGPTVAGGVDHDGDGRDDLAIGVSADGRSHVFFLSGRDVEDGSSVEDFPRLQNPIGGGEDDGLGLSLAMVPDVDGDGRGEILIGAPGRCCVPWDGRAYLVSGPALADAPEAFLEDLLLAGRAAGIGTRDAEDRFGATVASPGDFDGDGAPDLAAGARFGGVEFRGESYVVFGGDHLHEADPVAGFPADRPGAHGVVVRGELVQDEAHRVAPAGDFNGDGLADLLVGTLGAGKVYVVFGGPHRTVDLSMTGADAVRIRTPGECFGFSGDGDFDGDGVGDVAVSTSVRGEDSYTAYLILGEGAPSAAEFIRGDANDNQRVELADAVFLLGHLFLGGPPPPCADAADSDDDGSLEIADAIAVLNHLFLSGPAPPPPYPESGTDPTADLLDCLRTR